MATVRLETEIVAPPPEVREIVLDFARYHEWHTSFVQSIKISESSAQTSNILPGTILDAKLGGVVLNPVVQVNTAQEFSWHGSVFGGAFAGRHFFEFQDSKVTPGGTTFVHGEDYDGWLSVAFGEGILGLMRKTAVDMFEGYSIDVKARAEALRAQKEDFAEAEREAK